MSGTREEKTRVCYFYDANMGKYYYGENHPMKPHRLRMTHCLVSSYGLYRKMKVYRPHVAHYQEITQFHTDDYVDFLRRVSPDNAKDYQVQLQKFNLGANTDCPVFSGMYNFCQLYTGASIDGAIKLNHGQVDIAVNWSGGLHHAKKSEASGFCYINDIVLSILELLKYHARVLYIDIDIHHGDGVEEAFYTTDRVMTVSFHKFGNFFPGSGAVGHTGDGKGERYSVNFPLEEGIDDEGFLSVFKPVIAKVMEVYRPGAIVLQCGADSLTGDRLGCFNVTLRGHGEAVRYVKSFRVPLLVLGGGGYNIRNVSRCWTYETSVVLDTEVSNNIPYNDFFHNYGPDFKLHLTPSDAMENRNTRQQLDKVKTQVLESLSYIKGAPSVQMQRVPPDYFADTDSDDDDKVDIRFARDERRPDHEAEFYDDEKDQDMGDSSSLASLPMQRGRSAPTPERKGRGGRRGHRTNPGAPGPADPASESSLLSSGRDTNTFKGTAVIVPKIETPATPDVSDTGGESAAETSPPPQADIKPSRPDIKASTVAASTDAASTDAASTDAAAPVAEATVGPPAAASMDVDKPDVPGGTAAVAPMSVKREPGESGIKQEPGGSTVKQEQGAATDRAPSSPTRASDMVPDQGKQEGGADVGAPEREPGAVSPGNEQNSAVEAPVVAARGEAKQENAGGEQGQAPAPMDIADSR